MNERYLERDTRLKEFALKWKPGVEVEEELQRDFMDFCGQIASRKCLRMNIRGERIDDIVAEVQFSFMIAIATGKYAVTDAPVAGYIGTVTRNEIFNGAARQKAKSNWVEKYVRQFRTKMKNITQRPVEEEVIELEALRTVFEAIGNLNPEQQAPILLLAQGCGHEEVCQELQISDSVLRNRIYRARKVLREALDNQEPLL